MRAGGSPPPLRTPIDVQDHRGDSAANTNIVIEDVQAVGCRHIIRTANSPRGHAKLTLRRFSGRDCQLPVQVSHTNGVTIEELKIECSSKSKDPPIRLNGCQRVRLSDITVVGLAEEIEAIQQADCDDVAIERLVRVP